MSSKQSLTVLDNVPEMQAAVTNQAMLFAQLTFEEAKKNRLTREQVIKEVSWEPSKGKFIGQRLTVTRK